MRNHDIQATTGNIRRSTRGYMKGKSVVASSARATRAVKPSTPLLRNRDNDAQSEPDLPNLPVPVGDGPRTSRASFVAYEQRIHRKAAAPMAVTVQRSTPPESDPIFGMSSELDDASVVSSALVSNADHHDASEPSSSNVKRRERGLTSIRDPDLQLVTQMVTRRVMESVLFVNAFPSDDELNRTLTNAWAVAERQVGFEARRTKAVNQVVSAINDIFSLVNTVGNLNFGSSGNARLQLGGTLSGVLNLLLPTGTTSVMGAPIQRWNIRGTCWTKTDLSVGRITVR